MKEAVSLLQLLILTGTASAQTPTPPLPKDIGVYLGWVGSFEGNRLREGARLAKSSGFQTIRVPLLASVENDFGIGTNCHSDKTLEQLVSLPPYAEVFDEPAFRVIFLTVWGDSNSYNACQTRDPHSYQHARKRYLDPEYYSVATNREGMRTDYADLTYRLYKTYNGSGKLFGISNWEGDNDLYCDSAYYFATNPEFRSACEQRRTTSDVVSAYRQFLTLRQEGMSAGRKRAELDGLKGVSVLSIIEISAFHLLQERNVTSMLDGVLPFVPMPDYVSYSAWESAGAGPDQLFRDLVELERRFSDHLIAGEFGFDRGTDKSSADHAVESINAMRRAHLAYAVWWQIFDQPPILGLGDKGLYGLYDEKGILTETGKALLPALGKTSVK
jgi:hypothetical protein